MIPSREWFRFLTGVREWSRPRLQVENRELINGRYRYACGTVTTPDLATLRERFAQLTPFVYDPAPIQNIKGDVVELQADKANRWAAFQIASNFNGLEAIDAKQSPYTRNFVTNYIRDPTQGPRASIGCGAAAIWRRYLMAPFDMLSAYRSYVEIQNGYVVNIKRWPRKISDDHVRVLCTEAAQVTFRSVDELDILVNKDKNQRVHQIFCAAVNMGQGEDGLANAIHPKGEELAKFTLNAMYECTYLCAIQLHCQKLFLTRLGGGVFHNEEQWIQEAIQSAHAKYGAHIPDVYLVDK